MKKNIPISIHTLLLTTITIISWVFFSIYWAIKKPLPIVIPPEITSPINPDVDLEFADQIKEEIYFEEGSFEETKFGKQTINENQTQTQSEDLNIITGEEESEQ